MMNKVLLTFEAGGYAEDGGGYYYFVFDSLEDMDEYLSSDKYKSILSFNGVMNMTIYKAKEIKHIDLSRYNENK